MTMTDPVGTKTPATKGTGGIETAPAVLEAGVQAFFHHQVEEGVDDALASGLGHLTDGHAFELLVLLQLLVLVVRRQLGALLLLLARHLNQYLV